MPRPRPTPRPRPRPEPRPRPTPRVEMKQPQYPADFIASRKGKPTINKNAERQLRRALEQQ